MTAAHLRKSLSDLLSRTQDRPLAILGIVLGGIALKLALYFAIANRNLAEALCRFDCQWYVWTALRGYDLAPHANNGELQANWAFFPLFPAMMRVCIKLFHWSSPASGFILSTLFYTAFILLAHRYYQKTRDDASGAYWLVLLLLSWPYSFYFHIPYTEALYAALATACLLALSSNHLVLAALAAGLLTATRTTGVLLALAVSATAVWQTRRHLTPKSLARIAAIGLLSIAGLLAFMLYLWVLLGDPIAFVHAQAGWKRSVRNPLAVLLDFATPSPNGQPRFGLVYHTAWSLIGLAAAAYQATRRRFAEAALCAGTVLMALTAGTLWSVPRYVSACPVLIFTVQDALERLFPARARIAILAAFACLQLLLLVAWFHRLKFLL